MQTITTEDNHNEEFYKVPWKPKSGAPNSDLGGQGELSRGTAILSETWNNSEMWGRRQKQVFKYFWQGKQHMQRDIIKVERDTFTETRMIAI